ncbi:putative c2h2 type zinc finger domain protein [Erysiphe neolycopersici]|uniref:Putative c2h2 type zinc finger domain protein n=1 Tax=Erysiphe neolycopersici TaxID=212602 RepID=A0A420HBN7_9PEZI|nr:putative c2h2 type zinc finger domain protein [Erysiphe neolycopersici]
MAKRSRNEFEVCSKNLTLKDVENSITPAHELDATVNTEPSPYKFIELDQDKLDVNNIAPAPMMCCNLPPHRDTLKFKSFEEYNVHYIKEHTNRCLECFRNFPTNHLLSLHIEENHNTLFVIKKERGDKMYACFVEDCNRLCSTPQKRRMHMIDKHYFPKDYDFYVVNHGIGDRCFMLKSWNRQIDNSSDFQRSSINKPRLDTEMETTKVPTMTAIPPRNLVEDSNLNGLSSAMSALRFVPPSVRIKLASNNK